MEWTAGSALAPVTEVETGTIGGLQMPSKGLEFSGLDPKLHLLSWRHHQRLSETHSGI
jgi:hypothetical protein